GWLAESHSSTDCGWRYVTRLDVLVHGEEVSRIVLSLQCRQTLIFLSVRGTNAFFVDFAEIVDVRGVRQKRSHGLPELARPANINVRVCRAVPHGCNQKVIRPTAVPERGRVLWHTAPCTVSVVLDDDHTARGRGLRVEPENRVDGLITQRLQKARFPVAVAPLRPQKIGHGLCRTVRHVLINVRSRRSKFAKRPKDTLTILQSAYVDATDTHNRLTAQDVGQGQFGGRSEHNQIVARFFRRCTFILTPEANRFLSF